MKRRFEIAVCACLATAMLVVVFNKYRHKEIVHPTKLERIVGETLGQAIVDYQQHRTNLSGGVESRHAPNADKVGWRKVVGDGRSPQISALGNGHGSALTQRGIPTLSGSSAPPAQSISESNRITQALVTEGLSPEYAAEVYVHITGLAAQHRTNRGVFPGATTNGEAFAKWPLFEDEP